MPSNAKSLASTGLCVGGLIMATFACFSNKWAREDVQQNVLEAVRGGWGLWEACMHLSTGHMTCDKHDRLIIGADAESIVSRIFVIFAILFAFISLWANIIGMECSTLMKYPESKKKLRFWSGVLNLVGGALIFIAGLWNAIEIGRHHYESQYFNALNSNYRGRRETGEEAGDVDAADAVSPPLAPPAGEVDVGAKQTRLGGGGNRAGGVTYVLGEGVFMAMFGGLCLMVSGALALMTGCGESSENDTYNYNEGTQPAYGQNKQNYGQTANEYM